MESPSTSTNGFLYRGRRFCREFGDAGVQSSIDATGRALNNCLLSTARSAQVFRYRLGISMTATSIILVVHIALGAAGLILGPVAMTARKVPGLHTKAGEAYHWVMLGVCFSAATLAVLDWPRIWWFFPIAVGSYAFACLGYVAAKYRWQGWLRAHLAGQGGSYIAMVTALLVVNWETLTGTRGVMSPWAWALPTVVGSPIIAWVTREVTLGRRPKL